VLVELGQQVKQQRAPGLAKRRIPRLIQNGEVHAHQRPRNPPGLAVVLLPRQDTDQIDRGVEAHPFALQSDAGHCDGGGQTRLVRTGAADEHRVLCRFGAKKIFSMFAYISNNTTTSKVAA